MLIRYKKDLQKIAMGLLSFMPELKEIKVLQQTINEYEKNANWHLYLWRDEDILGVIGVRIENNEDAVIQHISVNPSHRNLGIGRKMVEEIQKMFQGKLTVTPDGSTEEFFNKCLQNDEEKEQQANNE